MSFLIVKNLEKKYGDNTIFKNINLIIKKGEFVTLLGPSGCGKSTLLRCIAGLDPVTSGDVLIDEENVNTKSPKERNIGMVFQNYALFPNLSVYKNIAFGLEMKKMPKQIIEKKVNDILELIGLQDKKNFYPSELSGGQKQRVAIARSVVTEPKILLLDEPLSALDAKVRKSLRIELRKIQKKLNITTVFVTHDQEEALTISDRIFVMNGGNIEQEGTPEEIYTEPKSEFIAKFMGNYNFFKGEQIEKIFGDKNCEVLVIRPEAIYVREKTRNYNLDDYIIRNAVIDEVMILGNVIRYEMICNEVKIIVDLLNRGENKIYEKGIEVEIMFLKKELKNI
ncbi:MAG: ABC transporter ATP-binding protein [Fusobacteriaceae bacterium]